MIKKWLRKKLSNWLGIDDVSSRVDTMSRRTEEVWRLMVDEEKISIDLGYKDATTFIVASPLRGGRVYAFQQRFTGHKEFIDFMDSRFPYWSQQVKRGQIMFDASANDQNMFLHEASHRSGRR